MRLLPHGAAAAFVALTGCSPLHLSLGSDDVEGGANEPVTADASAPTVEASAVDPFAVHFELTNGARVDGVALGCGAACVDVRAVATGGRPPYQYQWDDGSTAPDRHLCPETTTAFGVSAIDARTDGASNTAAGALVAQVQTCVDAGADAAPSGCAEATGYAFCTASLPDQVVNLAVPIEAGNAYTLHVHGSGVNVSAWQIDYWGTVDNACGLDERLGGFSSGSGPTDVYLCVTPSRNYDRIISHLAGPASLGIGYLHVAVCNGCLDGGT